MRRLAYTSSMSNASRSLIAPTGNPLLERALRDKLGRRSADVGSLGELEPLALRLGLMQNSLKPKLRDPQLMIFACDHGLAVDGIHIKPGHGTADDVHRVLTGQMPVSVLARIQGITLSVVDAGVADRVAPHDRFLVRKIAHGTRNTRVGPAMSVEQAHAAIRAGMEIGMSLPGNVVACAGLGVGGHVSAALVLSRLGDVPVRDLLVSGASMDAGELNRALGVAQTAQARHRELADPVEVLAAFGGFEMAMMAGVMLAAAQSRTLVMVDGMAACAALMVASKISSAVTDYCVFCRSQQHEGLDRAMGLFGASALLELGMNTMDGSGAALSWPLVRTAASLLTEVAEGEDPGPTVPSSGFVSLDNLVSSVGPSATSDEALLAALTAGTSSASLLAEPRVDVRLGRSVDFVDSEHVDIDLVAPGEPVSPQTID